MSWDAVAEVMRREFSSASEKLIAVCLADKADRDRDYELWPSVENTASECHVAKRTVQRVCKEFARLGILDLSIEAKGHNTRHYYLNIDALRDLPLTEAENRRRERRRARTAERAARAGKDGDQNGGTRGDTMSPLESDPGVTSGTARGDTDDARGDTDDIKSAASVTQSLSNTLREDPLSDPACTPAGGGAGAERPPPANAHWNAWTEHMRTHFGEKIWDVWLADLIPNSDDGTTLELATVNNFSAIYIKETYGEALEEILDRRIILKMQPWAFPARTERLAKAAHEQREARGERG